jgi:hypothetical protein
MVLVVLTANTWVHENSKPRKQTHCHERGFEWREKYVLALVGQTLDTITSAPRECEQQRLACIAIRNAFT